MGKLGLFLIVGIGILAFELIVFLHFAFTPLKTQPQEGQTVLIYKGEKPPTVVSNLITMGVIGDGSKMLWLGKLTRGWKNLKTGEYLVSASMRPIEIFRVFTSGVSVSHPLTIREGENIYEIAQDLEKQGLALKKEWVSLCKDKKFIESLGLHSSLEGYLFPDTYFLTRTMTLEEMARPMVKKFLSFWTPEFNARLSELHMTRHQVVTLASIIEKETGAPLERPLISSVFYNRLNRKIRLQSDPTTIYGMWEKFRGNLTRNDLGVENHYNTYKISGLPVGPIGNPGREALLAALYPASSDYLYFVSKNEGTHEFTKNFSEHQKAVRKYQLDPKAREGKSWRNLSKNLRPIPPR